MAYMKLWNKIKNDIGHSRLRSRWIVTGTPGIYPFAFTHTFFCVVIYLLFRFDFRLSFKILVLPCFYVMSYTNYYPFSIDRRLFGVHVVVRNIVYFIRMVD